MAKREARRAAEEPAAGPAGATGEAAPALTPELVEVVTASVPCDAGQRAALRALWPMVAGGRKPPSDKVVAFCRRAARDISPVLGREILAGFESKLGGSAATFALLARAAAAQGDPVTAFGYVRRVPLGRREALEVDRLAIETAVLCGEFEAARTAVKPLLDIDKAEAWVLAASLEAALAAPSGGAAREIAGRVAQAMVKRFPGDPLSVAAPIRVAALAGDAAVAARLWEAVPAELRQKPPLLLARAALETARKDADSAAQAWWDVLRSAEPTPAFYLAGAAAMRALQNADAAARMVAEGLALFPFSPRLLVVAARTARSAKRPAEQGVFLRRAAGMQPGDADLSLAVIALSKYPTKGPKLRQVEERLALHHARFPEHAEGWVHHAKVLRRAGRLDDAATLTLECLTRFPDNRDIALAAAEVQGELGNTERLIDIVSEFRSRSKNDPEVEAAFLRALSGSGHHAQAQAAADEAARRYPGDLSVVLERARVLTRQGKWDGALGILVSARDALGAGRKSALATARLGKEIRNVRLMLGEAAAPTVHGANDGVAEVMAHFESLGGAYTGCEFAVVQRQLGVDRVGLLRWTQINPDKLVAALNCRFDGVGDPEFTRIHTYHAGNDLEYYSNDTRFGMKAHTFVRVADSPPEVMLESLGRRLRFLRSKLLEDIESGERIMVYKAVQAPSAATLNALAAALRSVGPAPLLIVVKAERAAEAGKARLLAPGVAMGAIRYFMNAGTAGADIVGWRDVCTEAYRLFGRAEAAAA